ncbi:AbfB domain-containing protein [Virgisporangium aurantiacum]|nr:AbfB domain-containing protein [Virgisporangium aurantiacum]
MAVSLAAMLLVGAAVDQWTDSAPNTRRGTDPDTRAGATASPGTSSAPAGAVLPPPDLVGHVAESWRGTPGTSNTDTGAAGPQMTVGARIGLEPVSRPGFRVRHRNFVGRTDLIGPASNQLDRADSSFTVRKGLADPRCFSLEAVNFPGFFLRHRNFEIRLNRYDRSAQYAQDATFCVVTGLAGQQISLRSINFPDRYLSHRGDELRLDRLDQSSATRLAMTFAVRPALLPARSG